MHYATRCPNCRTAFRVKADQLAAMSGRVRCGRCAYVFNALEHLLPPAEGPRTEMPTVLGAVTQMGVAPAAKSLSPGSADIQPSPVVPTTELGRKIQSIEEDSFSDILAEAPPAPTVEAQLVANRPIEDGSDTNAQNTDAPSEIEIVAPDANQVTAATTVEEISSAPTSSPVRPVAIIVDTQAGPVSEQPTTVMGVVDDSPNPDLDLSALLEYGRSRKRFSWLWFIFALLAWLALAAQVTWVSRAALYQAWPASMRIWETICPTLKCELPTIRERSVLSVENVELEEKAKSPKMVIWTTDLRNNADYSVAFPTLELTLTDLNNQPVARRFFAPKEYLNTKDLAAGVLPGSSAVSLRVPLKLDEMDPAGYSVEAFYQ